MRCKNCGWPNKPGLTNCTKCSAPLVEEDLTPVPSVEMPAPVNDSEPEPELQSDPAPTVMSQETPLSGTVYETSVEGVDEPEAPKVEARDCPDCGYPMRAGVVKCPNCGHIAGLGQSPVQGTVNSWLAAENKSEVVKRGFTLVPVPRENEILGQSLYSYDGDNIVLNRGNTEQENYSITSKQQAVVTCEDGKWYIEDRSSQHTTFVLANRKIELKSGDTIIMGNRLFVFEDSSK